MFAHDGMTLKVYPRPGRTHRANTPAVTVRFVRGNRRVYLSGRTPSRGVNCSWFRTPSLTKNVRAIGSTSIDGGTKNKQYVCITCNDTLLCHWRTNCGVTIFNWRANYTDNNKDPPKSPKQWTQLLVKWLCHYCLIVGDHNQCTALQTSS